MDDAEAVSRVWGLYSRGLASDAASSCPDVKTLSDRLDRETLSGLLLRDTGRRVFGSCTCS